MTWQLGRSCRRRGRGRLTPSPVIDEVQGAAINRLPLNALHPVGQSFPDRVSLPAAVVPGWVVSIYVADQEHSRVIREVPRVETVLLIDFRRPNRRFVHVDDVEGGLAEDPDATYLGRVVRVRQERALQDGEVQALDAGVSVPHRRA